MSVIKKQHIFLPKRHLDLSKWAVIACDQFTQDKDYWQTVSLYTEDAPSTLNLILPEIYLSENNAELIKKINTNMNLYYQNGLICDEGPIMVLVNRKTSKHPNRLGIVLAVDLEEYSFKGDQNKLIRATEGTIVERIPPRVEIRKDSIFEFPHVMLLYDDRKLNIAKNLFDKKDDLEQLYSFNLNMEGGSIEGYKIKNVEEVIEKFNTLLTEDYLLETFNTNTPLLFVVGDGNHSLATAKEHWNNVKQKLTEEEIATHPARFALVEAINIHDSGIEFESIHRVVYNTDKKFIKRLKKLYKVNHKKTTDYSTQKIFVGEEEFEFDLPTNSPLAIKLVQDYIDKYLGKKLDSSVDYIHGIDELKKVCANNKNAVGITLPVLNKNQLFEFIINHGALPRKAFSIGDAREKRYYLEAHKIKLV